MTSIHERVNHNIILIWSSALCLEGVLHNTRSSHSLKTEHPNLGKNRPPLWEQLISFTGKFCLKLMVREKFRDVKQTHHLCHLTSDQFVHRLIVHKSSWRRAANCVVSEADCGLSEVLFFCLMRPISLRF